MTEEYSVLIENWDKPILTWLRRIPSLFIPFFLAFTFIGAVASFWADPSFGGDINKANDEPSRLLMCGAFALIVFPVIMALSWGMLLAIKQVSIHLGTLSHIRKTGFGTVIGSWISALSKLHLYVTLFYVLTAIILLVGTHVFAPSDMNMQIFEQLGLPGRAAGMVIFSIGAVAYIMLFSLMGYVMGTIPLAIFTACIFRVFSLKRRQYRAGDIVGY